MTHSHSHSHSHPHSPAPTENRQCLPRNPFSRLLHRWNLQGLGLEGRVLELGSGSGDNLSALGLKEGVGIESSPELVARAREGGLAIYTPDEFWTTSGLAVEGHFDALVAVRLAEHMRWGNFVKLLIRYAPLVRPGGKLVLIAPQEKGFLKDPAHVEFMDFAKLERAAAVAGFKVADKDSYPLPRNWGVSASFNDFVVTAIRSDRK